MVPQTNKENLAKISFIPRLHELYARLLMRCQNCLSWCLIDARASGTEVPDIGGGVDYAPYITTTPPLVLTDLEAS